MHIFATGKSPQYPMNSSETEWFASWFDSPYYPMLYRHRDESEAAELLTNLHQLLSLPKQACVLDLCCGQGRHARTLHSLGYSVVGIDLSPAAIEHARKLASEGQRFEVQDMRSFALPEKFDAVFNLFTSFGYFDSNEENMRVLHRIAGHLNHNGVLVIDYLNAQPLLSHKDQEASHTVDHVTFKTFKFIEGNSIVKQITVTDGEHVHRFSERVQLLTLDQFSAMLQAAGFEIRHVFGDYRLAPYQPEQSPRCLIIASKS